MTDYGHDLIFGTFLTPTADNARGVLNLAQLSDELGLDLVTIQDHPYQARFLDTWTLLSVIAANTVNVRVAPNVANLPLRPPAVLARSVATLDILSGGRVELGLGAGAFWDALAAVGGPRLTAADGVSALEEGIAVIRAMWDTSARSVRLDGKHYAVAGAHPGPAPLHDVGIWLGAYKPRMLAITGRLADGWLPSHSYAGPETLSAMNRVVDEAALAAAREPRAVRRLYNIGGRFSAQGRGFLEGPPTAWAEQLAELTLTEGMSAYILGSDEHDVIRRFADEVVPAVRELVAAERGSESRAAATKPAPAAAPAKLPSTVGQGGASPRAARSAFPVNPTPDDGTRLSAVQAWDEATRPSAPAFPADKDYTAHDLAVAKHLIDVHDNLRDELTRVRDLMEQVLAGSLNAGQARSHINTMTMRQNNWTLGTYCESYCRVVTTHHTLEDQTLFPHMRRSDPGLVPVIDRLQDEHVAIHDVLEGVDRALVAFVGGPDGAAELRSAVDLLTDTLLSHLFYEERELVEPLARYGLS
jgi:alkanesulfonate monooxygenase SsuD/methylene tetrahydromethanopterin reductase-like flavin-dependent oxidoreductase (luciferase family)/hemerythrin-like domain-containing protein